MGRKVVARRNVRPTRKLILLALAFAMILSAPLIAQMYDTVTIKKGDTLWVLSRKHLGAGARYGEWLPINTLRSNGNPHRIYPGEVLNIPGTMKMPEPEPEPEVMEVPISAIEQMLNDMNARLAGVAGELETIKGQLQQVDGRLGNLESQVDAQSRSAMPVLDLSSIEKRVNAVEQSVAKMLEAEASKNAGKHAELDADMKALRAELETLSGSVEAQAAIQKKALDELVMKIAAMQEAKDRTPEVDDKKRAVGLVSFLTAGLALLVVTATR